MAGCRGVEVGAECSEAAVALIEACLSQHAAARPTARQLVTALEAMQDSTDGSDPSPQAAGKAA
jgi:methylthioribose-1-phosphate isomerase